MVFVITKRGKAEAYLDNVQPYQLIGLYARSDYRAAIAIIPSSLRLFYRKYESDFDKIIYLDDDLIDSMWEACGHHVDDFIDNIKLLGEL